MKISIARRAASLALLGATALILAACSSVKLDDVNGDSGSGGSCLLYTSPSPRD